MKRALGAILAGLGAAIVLIAGISFAAHSMYAPAQPIDPNDAKAVESFVSTLPAGAFALILAGWGIATFAGAWLAARLSRSAVYGFVISSSVAPPSRRNILSRVSQTMTTTNMTRASTHPGPPSGNAGLFA